MTNQTSNMSPRIQYIADGIITTFETPFTIFNTNAIQVFFDDQLQKDTYSITLDNENKALITFTQAPAAQTVITLIRALPLERISDFQEGGALRAKTLNHEFDYQMACVQQIADEVSRGMTLPPYAVNTNIDLTLPYPKAGKAIIWNKDGTNLENSTVEINMISETLDTKVNTATTAAATATQKAESATQSADIAVQQAAIATEQANLALEIVGGAGESDFSEVTAENARKLIGNRVWISEEYPITAKIRTVVNHNLNLENPLMACGEVLLKCVAPELGYTAGEFFSNWGNLAQESGLILIIGKGTTVTQNTIETSTGYGIAGTTKNNSDAYNHLTLSKWKYVFRIYY